MYLGGHVTACRLARRYDFPNTQPPQLVEATWEDALKKSSDPPDEWINDREVLVGTNV